MRSFILFVFILSLFTQASHAEIKLEDLGVSSSEATPEANPEVQKELKIRKSKLETHQILGLTTWGMMTATFLTGNSALSNDAHMYLGISTAALYYTTAYFSLSAPKPSHLKDSSRVKWHKRLAWVHFPAMILTPILGYLYKKNEEDKRKHSSVEKSHSAVAGILYGSFTISAALMVIDF